MILCEEKSFGNLDELCNITSEAEDHVVTHTLLIAKFSMLGKLQKWLKLVIVRKKILLTDGGYVV